MVASPHAEYPMMIPKRHIVPTILLACALALAGKAWSQPITVDFDKKIILGDSLHLPSSTSAYSLLTMLPELLQRPGAKQFSNYDVKIDGMSVSQTSDAALTQLMIDDIERIEVSESPMDSYNKNGVGGSINLVLRDRGQDRRLWGSAGLNASYPLDLAPHLILGHTASRMRIRALVLGDFYRADSYTENLAFDAEGNTLSSRRSDTRNRYYSELARLYTSFDLTQKDRLTANLSESFVHNGQTCAADYSTIAGSLSRKQSTNFTGLLNYRHSFSRGYLLAELQYTFTPGNTLKDISDLQLYRSDDKNHTVAGKVEMRQALLPQDKRTKLNMTAGVNLNGAFKTAETSSQLYAYAQYDSLSPRNNTFFVQPYLAFDLTAGRFRMKAIAEYQYFHYDIRRLDDGYSVRSHDFTGKIMAEYHFTQHQTLRLIADRKLQRPGEDQLYPALNYSIENLRYQKGNPALTPVMSHEVKLDYISDYRWGEHTLATDATLSYNHISDIIRTVQEGGGSSGGGMLGQTLQYTTFANGGINHIASAQAMLLYRYRVFSLCFTGNLYHREIPAEGQKDHYTYCNLSLHPQFALADGWQGGAELQYFSRIRQQQTVQSGCTAATLTLGKRWKGLFAYAWTTVALQKYAADRTRSDDGLIEKRYEMVQNRVGAGIKYSF